MITTREASADRGTDEDAGRVKEEAEAVVGMTDRAVTMVLVTVAEAVVDVAGEEIGEGN